ncbi:MAG: dipeptide ABC transporter ATP-binding protein [Candidatus Aureabacteria bacterium]|nr:dipeptide ABC transporter ATP-binding protein [Candidatus Auribacterota bacterium]
MKEILKVENLKKYFPVKKGIFSRVAGYVKAVDSVSLAINKGKVVGLVGESGCGKTTLGRTIIKLYEPSEGKIIFDNIDITSMSRKRMRPLRKRIQYIFQDPYSSLNPRMTVLDIVGEGPVIHNIVKSNAEKRKLVENILNKVGLSEEHADRYPHEFSGGQRQRIGIARSMALNPELIVCDEPISALDVSIQAQIINLLVDLKNEFDMSYLFISHDLKVVEYISDEVAVMYMGRLVEYALAPVLYSEPLHPYTLALIDAIPVIDKKTKSKKIFLQGDVPSPLNPPAGCPFHTRCAECIEKCRKETPELREVRKGHRVACHRR